MPEGGNRVTKLTRPGQFTLECRSIGAELPKYYVRLKVSHCGVCGTDRTFFKGNRNEGYPITLGHEHCGTIIGVGASVKDSLVGNFVAIDPNYRCGSCRYCAVGASHLCVKSSSGFYTHRGYSEFIDIHTNYVRPLPNFRSKHLGAIVEPLSVAINAVDLICNIGSSKLLILGAGNIGTLLAFHILQSTENEVWIYDVIESKADAVRSLYPTRVTVLPSTDTSEFDVIFEATGSSIGFQIACEKLAKLGKIVVLSRYHADEPAIPDRLPWKQPTALFAHLNGDGDSFSRAAELLHNSWSDEHDHLLSLHTFSEIDAVFSHYDSLPSNKKILVME